jgi:Ca2+-binding RTX toxin-like protein
LSIAAFSVLAFGVAEASAACNGLTATITGTAGNDTLTGTSGADVIDGLGGDDTISGLGGNDTICGGTGYDTIKPGPGNDWIDGGSASADVLDYSSVSAAMTVNLSTGTAVGDGSDTIVNVNDVYGSWSFADWITGNSSSNYIVGWGGNDVLIGLAGNDNLQGYDDDDTLEGGSGNDTLNGNAGNDTVSYSNDTAAVTVNLSTSGSQNTVGAGSDKISNVENLTGSAYADTLTGSSGVNLIDGLAGADNISGGDGADTLTGGPGADQLHGGAGNDTLALDDAAADSTTASTCGAGTDVATSDAADSVDADCETNNVVGSGDTTPPIASLLGFTEISGTQYQHELSGVMWINTAQAVSFSVDVSATDSGSGMSQVEYPALGTNWSPGAGSDSSSPYAFQYTTTAGAANPGPQLAVARDNASNTTNVSFTVSADTTAPTSGSISYVDGLTSANNIAVNFSEGIDTESGVGTFQLQRRSAAYSGSNCGTFAAWTNIGGASPASPYTDTTVTLNNCYEYRLNSWDRVSNEHTITSTATAIVVNVQTCNGQTATIIGTPGNDTIYGTAGADVIVAGAGGDTIYGYGGNDVICAEDGYDTIIPGLGNDWIDGGTGGNVLDYSTAATSMTIDLATGDATGSGTDTFSNVNDAYGSGSFDDWITGNSSNNYIVGWGGNDHISGGDGNDNLQGYDDDDVLEGGLGNDTLNGNAGNDTLSYEQAPAAITVSIAASGGQATGGAGTDNASSFESIIGSAYADQLTGNAGANNILGGAGNDTITASDGNDTLVGGPGQDILHGGSGNDDLNLNDSAADNATASTCGAGTDTATADPADAVDADCENVTIVGSDTTPPTATLSAIVESAGSAYQHSAGSTVWINPTQTGSFDVQVAATDADSGMKHVVFPSLGTGWTPTGGGTDSTAPYSFTYSWSIAPASGTFDAAAYDIAGNHTDIPFTVVTDQTAPSGGTISYFDGTSSIATLNVTFGQATDSESGIASHHLQRRTATLNGSTCGAFASWADIGPPSTGSPYQDNALSSDTCYQYRLLATDRVGNETVVATGTHTARVKVCLPA